MRNELFKRQEIVMEIEADKNPSYADARKSVAEEIKCAEENVDILSVKGKFGTNLFVIEASVYDSKAGLDSAVNMRKTQKTRKEEKRVLDEKKKADAEAKKKAEEEAKAANEAQASA